MAKCLECEKPIKKTTDSYIYNEEGVWCSGECQFKWFKKHKKKEYKIIKNYIKESERK
jgi:DNA-directed RNA polymerase subunit RPC12/RpoP